MMQLRQSFLDGERHPDCDRCWREEDAGRTSKRQHTLARLQHVIDDREWSIEPGPLQFLDLKLGNICNLKCRICGSWSSSTFAAEEIALQEDRKNNFHYAMMRMGRWPREQLEFWQDLRGYFQDLRYLEFTGGEPFMISEHFDLLRELVTSGDSQHIEIHYNTNGTIWPQDAEQLWQHFQHVEIAFSIDDVGARFEYQRSNADWNQVEQNIQRFRDMRDCNSNITLQVCSTVSVFNILHVAELDAWIHQQAFDFVYWNMLHDPAELCLASLPHWAKHYVANNLRWMQLTDATRQEMGRVVEFMMQGRDGDGQQLKQRIMELDRRRGENLAEIDPITAYLVKYEAAPV